VFCQQDFCGGAGAKEQLLKKDIYKRGNSAALAEYDQSSGQRQHNKYRQQPPLLSHFHKIPQLKQNMPVLAHYRSLAVFIQK